jgi:hypothetical protein
MMTTMGHSISGIGFRASLRTGVLVAFAATAGTALFAAPDKASPAARQPVLVELFTSEGCSDCPPADAVLEQLDAKQPFSGVQAIVLSEHVTYWDHQGWSDPFSLDAIDRHQQQYVNYFSLPSPATPQFVVDGTAQVAGNDPPKLAEEIKQAAATPKLELEIDDAHVAVDGTVNFSVKAAPGHKGTLVAVVAENGAESKIAHGENAGRTLHYVAVVRAYKELGSNALDGRPLHWSSSELQRAEKDGEPLRLVVYVYNFSNGQVLGVAQQTISR